ncbi:MAG: 4Fe-4S ferredoxin iron-sulfur binding protein, partial [uncultured bacterium]
VYGRYILPHAEHLKARVKDIEAGKYHTMLNDLSAMSKEELEKIYVERERQPDFAEIGWQPKETRYL